jgi:hypothetical protein
MVEMWIGAIGNVDRCDWSVVVVEMAYLGSNFDAGALQF